MTTEQKISRIADWIVNESEHKYDEIECLLYSIYEPKMSNLPNDIDDAYGEIIEGHYGQGENR